MHGFLFCFVFFFAALYIVCMNVFVCLTVHVGEMKIYLIFVSVKPAKVYSVFAMANKTSIHLKWSVEKINWPQLFRIRYTVTPVRDQNPDWQVQKLNINWSILYISNINHFVIYF